MSACSCCRRCWYARISATRSSTRCRSAWSSDCRTSSRIKWSSHRHACFAPGSASSTLAGTGSTSSRMPSSCAERRSRGSFFWMALGSPMSESIASEKASSGDTVLSTRWSCGCSVSNCWSTVARILAGVGMARNASAETSCTTITPPWSPWSSSSSCSTSALMSASSTSSMYFGLPPARSPRKSSRLRGMDSSSPV
eukprot:2354646-Pleurochrysis_carterae.AAC.2